MLRMRMVIAGVAAVMVLWSATAALATGLPPGANYMVPDSSYDDYQTGNVAGNGFTVTWHTWSVTEITPTAYEPTTQWWYYAYQLGNTGFAPHIGSFAMNVETAVAQAAQYQGNSWTMMPDPRSDGSARPADWVSKFWNPYFSNLANGTTDMGWAADNQNPKFYHMLPPGAAAGEGSSLNPYFEFRSTFAPVPVSFSVSELDEYELSFLITSTGLGILNNLLYVPGPGTPNAIPEPATFGLLLVGLGGLVLLRRR